MRRSKWAQVLVGRQQDVVDVQILSAIAYFLMKVEPYLRSGINIGRSELAIKFQSQDVDDGCVRRFVRETREKKRHVDTIVIKIYVVPLDYVV